MAKIFPFKAVRAKSNKISLVSSRAVFSYGKRELHSVLDYNPYSFLQIINPERKEPVKTRPNTPDRFRRVKKKYEQFFNEEIFIVENKNSIYIYEQKKSNGEIYVGFVGAGVVQDYTNGIIKPHEETLTKRKKIFKEYLGVCQFNAEPVLLTYPTNIKLSTLIKRYQSSVLPLFNFTTQDRISHKVWNIDNPIDLNIIKGAFEGFNNIYIADGHHRMASSELYSSEKKSHQLQGRNDNLFLGYYIDESQLLIHGFNRLIKDLNGLTKKELLIRLEKDFLIKQIDRKNSVPNMEGIVTLYLENQWYQLNFRDLKLNDPVKKLDAFILNEKILEPIFNIYDLRNDKRIDFLGGEGVTEKIESEVDKGKFKIAFCLCPISLLNVKEVADSKMFMPPKTSWIEPKLRSGMLILDYNRS